MKLLRAGSLGLAVAAAFALTGCLLLPGKFDSTLDVRKDGAFAFTYKGEIQLLGLQQMIDKAAEAEVETPFTPYCTDQEATSFGTSLLRSSWRPVADPVADPVGDPALDRAQDDDFSDEPSTSGDILSDGITDGEVTERECTKDEIEEQKKAWEEERERKRKENKEMKEFYRRMLGGVDPEDPKSIDLFAQRIQRIEGWNSVKHIGKGVFEVDYAITGRLDRDFVFPSIPGYGMGEPFLHIERWKKGEVKVRASGFVSGKGLDQFAKMGGMGGMPMPGMTGMGTDDKPPVKPVEGSFVITTDAAIRTNNTDAGPDDAPNGQIMRWTVGIDSETAPEALLRLAAAGK